MLSRPDSARVYYTLSPAVSTDTLPIRHPSKDDACYIYMAFHAYDGYPKLSGLAAWSENCKWYNSATRCSCIAILWIILVSFDAKTLCVAPQQVFIVVIVYFVSDSVRKLTFGYTLVWVLLSYELQN